MPSSVPPEFKREATDVRQHNAAAYYCVPPYSPPTPTPVLPERPRGTGPRPLTPLLRESPASKPQGENASSQGPGAWTPSRPRRSGRQEEACAGPGCPRRRPPRTPPAAARRWRSARRRAACSARASPWPCSAAWRAPRSASRGDAAAGGGGGSRRGARRRSRTPRSGSSCRAVPAGGQWGQQPSARSEEVAPS
jgi:hypothetical protein